MQIYIISLSLVLSYSFKQAKALKIFQTELSTECENWEKIATTALLLLKGKL